MYNHEENSSLLENKVKCTCCPCVWTSFQCSVQSLCTEQLVDGVWLFCCFVHLKFWVQFPSLAYVIGGECHCFLLHLFKKGTEVGFQFVCVCVCARECVSVSAGACKCACVWVWECVCVSFHHFNFCTSGPMFTSPYKHYVIVLRQYFNWIRFIPLRFYVHRHPSVTV